MQKRFFLFIICVCIVLTMGSACSQKNPDHEIRIVTTIFPPYDFARQITSGLADVTMLLSPGEEVHTYEPSPKDLITVQNCDLFICVGGESEAWVDRLLSSPETASLRVIRLMDCVQTVTEETVEGMTVHEHDEAEEPELDEHVWTSPKNALTILSRILDAICEIDPSHAETYRTNAAAYSAQIETLDREFSALFADGGEIIVADRFPFRYLADAYNITYYAAYPGCSNDAEPSSATVKYLIDRVREDRVPVVFTIEFSNGKLADILCEETGCRRLELHSCHNLTKSDFDAGVTYADLMRRNLENLREAVA